jgi:hypothetical protein
MKASDMLLHAAELVGGQRAEDYGDKTENHKRIAALWTYWMVESRQRRGHDDAAGEGSPADALAGPPRQPR